MKRSFTLMALTVSLATFNAMAQEETITGTSQETAPEWQASGRDRPTPSDEARPLGRRGPGPADARLAREHAGSGYGNPGRGPGPGPRAHSSEGAILDRDQVGALRGRGANGPGFGRGPQADGYRRGGTTPPRMSAGQAMNRRNRQNADGPCPMCGCACPGTQASLKQPTFEGPTPAVGRSGRGPGRGGSDLAGPQHQRRAMGPLAQGQHGRPAWTLDEGTDSRDQRPGRRFGPPWLNER